MAEQKTSLIDLTAAQLAELGERLDAERRRLLDRYEETEEREDEITLGEAEDMVDRAEDSWDKEEVFAERQGERTELLRVEEALGRLAAGTYGHCFYCGDPIPFERLKVVPATRFCAVHQEELEAGKIDERHPHDWPTSGSVGGRR